MSKHIQTKEKYILTQTKIDELFEACENGTLDVEAAVAICDITKLRDIDNSSLLNIAITFEHNELVESLLSYPFLDTDESKNRAFLRAVKTCNEDIMDLIWKGVDGISPQACREALKYACHTGNPMILQWLLDVFNDAVDVNECLDHVCRDRIYPAYMPSHVDVVRVLINAGADAHRSAGGGFIAKNFGCCSINDHGRDILDTLVADGAVVNLDHADMDVYPVGSLSFVKHAVSEGFDSQAHIEKMVQSAARMTTTEVLEYLFGIVKERGYELQINVGKLLSSCRDNGVANYLFSKLNVDLSSIAGRDRVLEHAVQSGNAMIVREFVNHSGIQIDNRGQYFGGMLSYASDPTIIRLLLNAKADVTIDDSDDPVMGAAIEELQLESVKMLVEAGAGRSKRSFRYALELSCTDDKVDDKIAIINLLIDVGASTRDVYAWDNVNSAMYTCLHHTAIGFDVHPLETIRALHERDPGMLNCTDYRYGITPLMLAVSRQDVPVSVVKELLEMGADMDIKDSTGVPLLQLLFLPPPDESGAGDFLRDDTPSKIREKLPLLLSLGADPNVTEFKGVTIPMMLLAADGTGTDSTETFFRDIDASEEDDVSWSSNYSDDACSIFISDILDSILARPTAAATMPSDEDESVSQPSKRQRR